MYPNPYLGNTNNSNALLIDTSIGFVGGNPQPYSMSIINENRINDKTDGAVGNVLLNVAKVIEQNTANIAALQQPVTEEKTGLVKWVLYAVLGLIFVRVLL